MIFGPVAKFLCSALLDVHRADPGAFELHHHHIEDHKNIHQKGSMWRVLRKTAMLKSRFGIG